MQRDLVGYGPNSFKVAWPLGAKLAINFVLNFEEGSESNILDGDDASESYLSDLPGVTALKQERNLSVESIFEYGSRVGVWRLLNLFQEQNVPLTIFTTGLALERNLDFAEALKTSSHEVAGHGYRWINYRHVKEFDEREDIQKTINNIQVLCQKEVMGWYTGRKSVNTRKLIIEAGLRYDSDSYADDLPYWIKDTNKQHLIIPYQLDTNDARYSMSPGWTSGEDFFQYLKASFECLYSEGKNFPKMMTVGLHPRLSGRPGRAQALRRFIEYVKLQEDVWICRRVDIADYWYKSYGRV